MIHSSRTSNCTARRSWLYRITISVRGKSARITLISLRPTWEGTWICYTVRMGHLSFALKSRTASSIRKPINKIVCKLNHRETLSLVCKPTTEPDRLAGLRDILSHVAVISLWEWARVWNSWENSNRKRTRDTASSAVAMPRVQTRSLGS